MTSKYYKVYTIFNNVIRDAFSYNYFYFYYINIDNIGIINIIYINYITSSFDSKLVLMVSRRRELQPLVKYI
jgi:hypothetical protein